MKSLYLNTRLFLTIGIIGFLFLVAYIYPSILFLVKLLVAGLLAVILVDSLLLFRIKGIKGRRIIGKKFSNGDQNSVNLYIENRYSYPTEIQVIDEVPVQFQVRDTEYKSKIASQKTQQIAYKLRPTQRGEYIFGHLNVYASSPIGFVSRRYQFEPKETPIPVYPSFLQMRKYELMAISNRLSEYGIKKMRRIGQSQEFEQIRNYVEGDDYRNINWNSTARRNRLMVNQYQDEKSQRVYSVIDKGRSMQMPFDGMSLLDYAINAALVISNIAIKKEDKAGLVTFNHKISTTIKADKVGAQMRRIQEALYNQETNFLESDFEKLYALFRTKLSNRALILLYTNFESSSALQRQLPYLRKLARQHVLVVIFFENTELYTYAHQKTTDVTSVYDKIIAEKFVYEKKHIVKDLNKYGIHAVLTAPENLTVNTINKYLELKARGFI